MRPSVAHTASAAASTSGWPPAAACGVPGRHAAVAQAPAARGWGAGAPPRPQQAQQPHGARLPRCRVTNERRELRDPQAADNDDDDFIVVDPINPLPDPHLDLGPLERRIGLPYEEALFEDAVDAEAEAYWFTEPAEGWNSEPRRLRKLREEEVEGPDSFAHVGAAAAGRAPLSGVREGQVLHGTVAAQLLYHGAQIDLGVEYDGLLPVAEEQWEGIAAAGLLDLGSEVEVRVHRVRDAALFRFPIQLAATDRQLASMIVAPEDHAPPMDLRSMSLTPEQIVERSEGRRSWEVKRVRLQLQDELELETGEDLRRQPPAPLVITRAQAAARDAAAERIMRGM